MKSTSDIILKLLGILLLTAAVLKAWQLVTEPLPNKDIWTNRAFLIFTVEFELALAIWLLSGLVKKAAWLATTLCFLTFSAITLYKALTGAASCGCFGSIQVNPWITLFAIDLPALTILAIFRPALALPLKQKSITQLTRTLFTPLPPRPRLTTILSITLITLTLTTGLLALNEPAKTTTDYEVLEPETWIGQKLPILDHIDIADQLRDGNWLILLYHHDCPDCQKALSQYEQMARGLAGSDIFLRVAFVEVPPYGRDELLSFYYKCSYGRLAGVVEWFVTTPVIVYTENGIIRQTWENNPPELKYLLKLVSAAKNNRDIYKIFTTIKERR